MHFQYWPCCRNGCIHMLHTFHLSLQCKILEPCQSGSHSDSHAVCLYMCLDKIQINTHIAWFYFPLENMSSRTRMVFGQKVWKVRNAKLGGGFTRIAKELWRVWFLPPENFWSLGPQVVHSNAFLGHLTPTPPKKFLFRFTLISRMVLGVGKKVWNQT